MSSPDRANSSIRASVDLGTLQAKAVELVHSMTSPYTAERIPPLEVSTSRARSPISPTSPAFSPLTPTPLSPDSSPTDKAGDEDKIMADIDLADSEVSPSGKTLIIDEFERYTMQAREKSRKTLESASEQDSGVEDFRQHSSPGSKTQCNANAIDPRKDLTEPIGEATLSRDQSVSQERQSEAQNEGEDLPEPERETTPTRQQAAWVTGAVGAYQANKKVRFPRCCPSKRRASTNNMQNLLNKGTVLLILDPMESSKSCLLDANILCRTSEVLGEICEDAQAKSVGCVSQQQLSAVLVLSSAPIPDLVAEALDATIESVLPPKLDAHPPAETGRTRTTRSSKIKAESDQGDSSPATSDDSEMPKTDWPKAYESFFRIIAGKKHGISKSDLSTALPQIQGVVQIAQKYSAIHAVESTFVGLLLGYVEHHTLYSTIEKWPAHCLNLGVALKSRLVYDEAFKHLVGYSANFKDRKVFPDLSDDIQAMIQRRSFELYSARRDVEEKLMLMTLPGRSPPNYPSQYVSQHDQRMAYNTVNIFRDWIAWHIGHLRHETEAESAPFYLCEHANSCTNVAGFYQTIAAHDYLDADEVYDSFDRHYKITRDEQDEQEAVSQALESLKAMASEHVEKLSESTLHLADKSGLRYLTCVEVDAVEDVPWDTGSDEDSSDEDMDEDSD